MERFLYKIIYIYLAFVALSPLIFYDNFYIEVHDNLDSSIAWLASMNSNNAFFSSEANLPFLNGLSRHYLPSELQINNTIFAFLEPLNAYIAAYLAKVLIGSVSFIYLLQTLKVKIDSASIIVAILFSLLPGYPNLYFAQASLPLILALIIQYCKTKEHKYLCYIALYPLLSELARYGIFIIGYSLLASIAFLITKKNYSKELFVSSIVLSISYLITEYHFIYIYVISDNSSIRDVMIGPSGDLSLVVNYIIRGIFLGQAHAGSNHFIIFILIPLFVYCCFRHKLRTNTLINLVIATILFNSIVYGLYLFEFIRDFISWIIPPLKGWNFGRTIWFNPLLLSLLFLFLFQKLAPITPKWLMTLIIGANVLVTTLYPTYNNDFSKTIRCELYKCNHMSYSDFLSHRAFDELKEKIGYNGENVISFGLHPSILVFNGFTTLDMYHNGYGLDYKKTFRDLISPSLESNKKWMDYYDNWGGRAYLYPTESNRCWEPTFLKKSRHNIKCTTKGVNPSKAGALKLKYIISAYPLYNTDLTEVVKISGRAYDLYAYTFK